MIGQDAPSSARRSKMRAFRLTRGPKSASRFIFSCSVRHCALPVMALILIRFRGHLDSRRRTLIRKECDGSTICGVTRHRLPESSRSMIISWHFGMQCDRTFHICATSSGSSRLMCFAVIVVTAARQVFKLAIVALVYFPSLRCRLEFQLLFLDFMLPPNKSPEPTAVGAVSSAVAVHVASRRWLSFLR